VIVLIEQILVVPVNHLKDIVNKEPGLHNYDETELEDIIKKRGEFRPRNEMETNPDFKQIIPYVAMYDKDGKILTLIRTTAQSEKRLHNKVSLGIGGHINDEDAIDPLEAYKTGTKREINEEVDVELLNNLEFLGVIYDGTTDVGSVHLGMAFKVMVDFKDINEKDKFEHSWKNVEELKNMTENMEGWSVHILEKL
jgi:predicted NUDIX family phosphoesterase